MNAESASLAMNPHPGNPTLQAEHMAAMNLAAADAASHVAVASGPWSSPSTWRDGLVPDEGSRALIPEGLTVEVDGAFRASLEWVRVNGTLRFATDVDTALKVDTLITAPGSRLEIGTPMDPVQADVSARIEFADRGPLNVDSDPLLIGRGAILHGATQIHGAAKSSAMTVARDPRQGDREILLSEIPSGWVVGDALVIAGTRPDGSGDETARIASIEADRILLEEPLRHDHSTPRDHLKVHVANLTRNVVFSSENTALDRRGHVMFMHTRDVDVANAAFKDLGRTDKLRPLDDPYFDDEGFFVEETGTNTGGRYSVHFHRNGVDRVGTPAVVRGSVVDGNPGWGFVNHSSYVDFIDNVAFDVVGAAFSTEAGDEIGSFDGNIAIRMHGSGEEPISRQEEGDFGHAGDGFWLQGPGVRVENNVAAGATGSGLILYAEPLFEDGLGITTFPSANLPDPTITAGAEDVPVSLAPLATFRGNESYGSALGAQIYYHRTFITIEEEQEEQAALQFAPSLVEDMDLWSNATGMLASYTVDTEFRDLRIIGPVDGSGDTGFDAASNFYNRGTHLYENLSVEDYEIGFSAPRSGVIDVDGGYFNNITDFYLNEPRQLGRRIRFGGDLRFGDRSGGVVEGERVERAYFEMDPELAPAADSANEHFLLDDQVLLDFGPYSGQQLYFFEQSADHVLFPEPPDQLTPDDPGPTIGDEFVGVTNADIFSVLGQSFGGAIAPDDALELDRILGLVGTPATGLPALDPNPLPSDEDDGEEVDFEDDLEEEDLDGLVGGEFELALPEKGGTSRLELNRDALINRSPGGEHYPTDAFETVNVFGSDRHDKVKFLIQSDSRFDLEEVSLFTASGDDRIILRQNGSETPEWTSVHGEDGRDRLDAARFSGMVELDGGPGNDFLIGSQSESELWGGPGRDRFLVRQGAGLQWLMDFDPEVDRVRFRLDTTTLALQPRDEDLWLLSDSQPVAVFDGLADQQELIQTLII
ncbi:MAG: G8 domain-containing protein [Synechococcus sp.]|nr:G8 domain-containing protein [Synechococcus sp.]